MSDDMKKKKLLNAIAKRIPSKLYDVTRQEVERAHTDESYRCHGDAARLATLRVVRWAQHGDWMRPSSWVDDDGDLCGGNDWIEDATYDAEINRTAIDAIYHRTIARLWGDDTPIGLNDYQMANGWPMVTLEMVGEKAHEEIRKFARAYVNTYYPDG